MGDLYQMLAYSVRYDCALITLVYPAMMGQTCDELMVSSLSVPIQGENLTIRIVLIDLQQEIIQTVHKWRDRLEQEHNCHPV
jgi:5-methylcytosine-specific restriction endonuclease McrBC regulatory subunit McrC